MKKIILTSAFALMSNLALANSNDIAVQFTTTDNSNKIFVSANNPATGGGNCENQLHYCTVTPGSPICPQPNLDKVESSNTSSFPEEKGLFGTKVTACVFYNQISGDGSKMNPFKYAHECTATIQLPSEADWKPVTYNVNVAIINNAPVITSKNLAFSCQ